MCCIIVSNSRSRCSRKRMIIKFKKNVFAYLVLREKKYDVPIYSTKAIQCSSPEKKVFKRIKGFKISLPIIRSQITWKKMNQKYDLIK